MLRNCPVVVAALVVAAGCASVEQVRRAESPLAAAQENEQLIAARVAVADAEDAFLDTERAVVEADRRRERAKTQADVVLARVRQEELGLELAKAHGDDVGRTRTLELTRSMLEAARAKVRYLDAVHAEAVGERLVASAAVSLARAELGRAQLVADESTRREGVARVNESSSAIYDAITREQVELAKLTEELEQRRSATSTLLDEWRQLESRIGKGTREASAPVKPRGRPQP